MSTISRVFWPTALKLGCDTNIDTLFVVMGFISLVDKIQFLLTAAAIFAQALYIPQVQTPQSHTVDANPSEFLFLYLKPLEVLYSGSKTHRALQLLTRSSQNPYIRRPEIITLQRPMNHSSFIPVFIYATGSYLCKFIHSIYFFFVCRTAGPGQKR